MRAELELDIRGGVLPRLESGRKNHRTGWVRTIVFQHDFGVMSEGLYMTNAAEVSQQVFIIFQAVAIAAQVNPAGRELALAERDSHSQREHAATRRFPEFIPQRSHSKIGCELTYASPL